MDNTVSETFGLACPGCGRDDEIVVVAYVSVHLTPDGSETFDGNHEWDRDSSARCDSCGYCGPYGFGGTVRDFLIEKHGGES